MKIFGRFFLMRFAMHFLCVLEIFSEINIVCIYANDFNDHKNVWIAKSRSNLVLYAVFLCGHLYDKCENEHLLWRWKVDGFFPFSVSVTLCLSKCLFHAFYFCLLFKNNSLTISKWWNKQIFLNGEFGFFTGIRVLVLQKPTQIRSESLQESKNHENPENAGNICKRPL